MIIYRLEDTAGDKKPFTNVGSGVYGGSKLAYQVCSDSHDSSHPSPREESKLCDIFDASYVCCFTSVQALRSWFDELEEAEGDTLERLRIATYLVEDDSFHQGRFQAIAKAEDMTLIETHKIDFKGM